MELQDLNARNNSKIVYFDNLKIILTILVVLHHVFITYGASGGWYFIEKTSFTSARIIMSIITISNQAFFMGLFFFLSSYFIDSSVDKKGTKKFVMDRLKRLGIPLIFYSIILSPSLNYIAEHYGQGKHNSFVEYLGGYHHWIDFGVLWFVAALLLFDLIFLLFKIKSSITSNEKLLFPNNKKILLFAILLGLISYLVRGYFPIGWTLFPLGFQLGDFPQYILLFIFGIVAYRNDWLNAISYKNSKRWVFVALILVIIVLPFLYIIEIQTMSSPESMSGHFDWQSLLFAEWEQITGIAIIVGLLGVAKHKWNRQTSFNSRLARSSYGVYIFHPVFVIGLSLLAQRIEVDPIFKLLFVAPLSVYCSYKFAQLLLKIPYISQVI
jgi:surface polysaccharide O-acyltransferase-like enzyme